MFFVFENGHLKGVYLSLKMLIGLTVETEAT